MLEYINALIPGTIGVLILLAPGLFTKATGSEREKALKQLNFAATLCLAAAALAALSNLLGP